MSRPSNNDLLSERKAIAALLLEVPGETNAEKVKALLDEVALLKANPLIQVTPGSGGVIDIGAIGRSPADGGPGYSQAEIDAARKAGSGPVETVRYSPGTVDPNHSHDDAYANATPPFIPSRTFTQPEGMPPMSAALGDMTPGIAEWCLEHQGKAATAAKYSGRIHLLSPQLQAALS